MGERSHAEDERLLETFLDLVRIDSPSGEESACAAYCRGALEQVGCAVRFDESAPRTGSDTGNLIAEIEGTALGTLVLSAHLDCVEPCRGVVPKIADGLVFSTGDTVLGADDKAGLAAAIEAVRRVTEDGRPHPAIRCVFSVQEEVGLHGAKYLAAEDVAGDVCLVLDAAGRPGGIVTGAPTHYTFTATFVGRAAHAGVEPETGVSAIKMAAEAIAALEVGRIDPETTANVGTVSGGTATNVIAAAAVLTGECRSLDRERVEALRSHMDETMRLAAARHGGSVEIEWVLEYEGFSLAQDASAVALVADACADVGLAPKLFTTGGGSDANIIASHGVAVVALSCGMEGVHSTTESMRVVDLVDLTELVTAVAWRMGRQGA